MQGRRKTRPAIPNGGPSWAASACDFIGNNDPTLAEIIRRVGPLTIAHRRERFPSLVQAIVFQQLAGRAAQAIYQRFVRNIGGARFPTPEQVLAASDEELRGAGLSRAKITYLRDLALHVRDGRLNFRRFTRLDDEAVIAELVGVRGIGRWTAEMFLMFNLRRPDVLPVDDLGLRNAVAKAYGLGKPPTARELTTLAERWRPYRSAAVWYLWQSTRVITPDSAAPIVKPVAAARRRVAPAAKVGATAGVRSAAARS